MAHLGAHFSVSRGKRGCPASRPQLTVHSFLLSYTRNAKENRTDQVEGFQGSGVPGFESET
jgi:hypothetical protein